MNYCHISQSEATNCIPHCRSINFNKVIYIFAFIYKSALYKTLQDAVKSIIIFKTMFRLFLLQIYIISLPVQITKL